MARRFSALLLSLAALAMAVLASELSEQSYALRSRMRRLVARDPRNASLRRLAARAGPSSTPPTGQVLTSVFNNAASGTTLFSLIAPNLPQSYLRCAYAVSGSLTLSYVCLYDQDGNPTSTPPPDERCGPNSFARTDGIFTYTRCPTSSTGTSSSPFVATSSSATITNFGTLSGDLTCEYADGTVCNYDAQTGVGDGSDNCASSNVQGPATEWLSLTTGAQ